MPASAEAPPKTRRLTVLARDVEPGAPEDATPTPRRLGPLLAVCGLVGGAGTTTLAYLVSLAAARQSSGPVLVADTGGPSVGLAVLTGQERPRSLPELAAQVTPGQSLPADAYATASAGVRVLASAPDFTSSCTHAQLTSLLEGARLAHTLTVVDCGTLGRSVERVAAMVATHRALVMPATSHGVACGRRLLDAIPRLPGRELIVARREFHQSKAPLRELRQIAAERSAPLVLAPPLTDLEARKTERAPEAAQVPLQAILGALRR